MIDINELFLALCRQEICGEGLPELKMQELTDEVFSDLFRLSRHHDMAHIVSDVLFKFKLISKENACYEEFKNSQMKAHYRYERIRYELDEICRALNSAEIPFIPLKGSYIRQYYPEPWMRTSTDIDVLVHESDLERASEALKTDLGYRFRERGSHDIAFVTKSGLLIELHFDLIEEVRYPVAVKLLSEAWNYAVQQDNGGYRYELSDEMFCFYHIAHMVKHFENGGCGVRSFMDLWILEHRIEHDDAKRDELYKKGGLYRFAEAARSLAEVWFSGKEPTELDRDLQSYILKGGTFGVAENGVVVKQVKKGGRKKYILSRLFLPMSMMKKQHPALEKHPWLAPLYYTKRLFKVFNKDTRGKAQKQLDLSGAVSGEQAQKTAEFLNKLGL